MPEQESGKSAWEAIDSLRESHVQTQKDLSGVISSLKGLADEVRQIAHVVNRPPDKTNWIGFGALMISVLMCAGVYSNAIISPIRQRGDTNAEITLQRLVELPREHYDMGRNDAFIEVHGALITDMKGRIHTVESKASHCEATVEGLERWITAVDNQGSRKHIVSAPEAMVASKTEGPQG